MKKGFSVVFSIMIFLLFASDSMSNEGLKITSPAFENNAYIPAKYTCDSMDSNPPLLIKDVPAKAKSLALIVDDIDAPGGIWVHWVVWNIPAETKEIRENSVPSGAKQGLNDFRKNKYNGPCPPPGIHRYFFRLYALDTVLDLKPDAVKSDMEKAMTGHIIEQAHMIGLYKRR
jgi:Raf kinase inhibitor-like YbhB/YbcL family protein